MIARAFENVTVQKFAAVLGTGVALFLVARVGRWAYDVHSRTYEENVQDSCTAPDGSWRCEGHDDPRDGGLGVLARMPVLMQVPGWYIDQAVPRTECTTVETSDGVCLAEGMYRGNVMKFLGTSFVVHGNVTVDGNTVRVEAHASGGHERTP
jgi:hypothetical protein